MTSSRIVAWMFAAIAILGGIAYWDEKRNADESLEDFGTEQVMVARAAANAFRNTTDARPSGDTALAEVTSHLRVLERPKDIVVLLKRPSASDFLTLDGATVTSPPIAERFARGLGDTPWVRLGHDDSAHLGLLPRTSIAGIAEFDRGREGTWGLVVVTSAHRERDREERGLWRVGLGFFIAAALVITFGTLALRVQRADLELKQRLAIAEAVAARDERLVRADKLASLGAFALGIAHQVATPLGVIVGRAERLAPRLADDPRSQRIVAVIAEQAQRINRIIRAFLTLARGGAPTLEHIDPADVASTAIDLVRHRFDKARIRIELDAPPGLPKIACDPRLFEQVLVNLLLNACDASDPGGVVRVRIEQSDRAVAFLIVDDGVGVAHDVAARATEAFFTTKPADEGTGLGLAIAREIVTHHRGELSLEPRDPRGTCARVEVPINGVTS